jgi:hypothetical protein
MRFRSDCGMENFKLIRLPRLTFTIKCRFFPSPHGATAPSELGPSHYRSFTITLNDTHAILSRAPLDEWLSVP